MRQADPDRLLRTWERAVGATGPVRGTALLEALDGEVSHRPTLVQVEAALAAHRIAWFGRSAPMLATCPDCHAEYELLLDLAAVDWQKSQQAVVEFTFDGEQVTVRPPCSADMVAIAHVSAPEAFADALFKRCIVSGWSQSGSALPAEMRMLAAEALQQAGHAPRTVDLGCGACGARWQPLIDIAGLLWTEIDTQARRLLHEVQRLASAFHWSEHDILALSPARREFYLNSLA